MKMIQVITCESGDWYVLKVDSDIVYEGHSIPTMIWLNLFDTYFSDEVTTHETVLSDEDMLGGRY